MIYKYPTHLGRFGYGPWKEDDPTSVYSPSARSLVVAEWLLANGGQGQRAAGGMPATHSRGCLPLQRPLFLSQLSARCPSLRQYSTVPQLQPLRLSSEQSRAASGRQRPFQVPQHLAVAPTPSIPT